MVRLLLVACLTTGVFLSGCRSGQQEHARDLATPSGWLATPHEHSDQWLTWDEDTPPVVYGLILVSAAALVAGSAWLAAELASSR